MSHLLPHPCPRVVYKANEESKYTDGGVEEERARQQASQEPRAPDSSLLSDFLQALQGREVLNCFYTPLPA